MNGCRLYLEGRKQLVDYGAIVDKKIYEAYKKQRGELSQIKASSSY